MNEVRSQHEETSDLKNAGKVKKGEKRGKRGAKGGKGKKKNCAKQWKLWADSCGVRLAPGLKPPLAARPIPARVEYESPRTRRGARGGDNRSCYASCGQVTTRGGR